MAPVPAGFHETELSKDDLHVTDTGKVAFKDQEIADAIEAEIAARDDATARRATNNCRCTVNRCPRPPVVM
jgi:hypothetical protein